MAKHMVIIGNGVAGFAAARCLRREDADATISVFSDESHPFYLRSRLKEYIAGSLGEYEMILESRNLYRRERLNLFLQSPVLGLDTGNSEVLLARGERVRYDRLLLAMGCSPTPLSVPGGDLEGIFTLHSLTDAEAIRQWMGHRRRAVVVGEGIVSIQLAESLARLGAEVQYMLLGECLWPDVLDPAASDVVERLLAGAGVRFHKRVKVDRVLGRSGAVAGVELAGGRTVECDMLGHGCAFRPNTDLLADSPVACAKGVLVNEYLQTSVEGVYAAGDVVSRGADDEGSSACRRWRNSFRLGETAAMGMLDRPEAVESFGVSVRTQVCGVNLAVVGRGNLAEVDPSVHVESAGRDVTYRRLVFREDVLVGAVLIGDTSHASMIEKHVFEGTLRGDLEESLLPALLSDEPRLVKPLESSCPICTDRVRLPRGALVGREFSCRSCSIRLKLAYSEGRLAIVPAGE